MSSKQFDVSSRVTRVTSKSNKTEYDEVKVPQPTNDFHSLYKSASGISTGNANLYTIDVLPNFVPIVMFCIYHAASFSAIVDIKSHAKVSTATLASYFLGIIYAHILVQDAYLRPTASPAATDFLDTEFRRDFLNFMLNLPVPQFLEPILAQLMITTTDQRPNIVYCPSANGYSFTMHYGRFIPLNFFTHIHYIASTVQSNTNINNVLAEYLTTSCLTVTDLIDEDDSFNYTPANFLGIHMNQGVMTACSNKLYQSFLSVFNPVLLRATQARHSFAPVYIRPAHLVTSRHNFYDAVFSSSVSNFSEYRTLFTSVAATFNGVIPCSSDLAQVYATISGTGILQHGYSDFALPTWYSYQAPADFDNYNRRPQLHSDEQRANALRFLTHNNLLTGTDTYIYPHATHDGNAIPVTMTENLVLISREDPAYTTSPYGNKSRIQYNSELHFMPRVRILNFGSSSPVSSYLATLSGLVIESLDLDASTVPQPHANTPIGVDNSHFFSSAIPYRKITPGFDFNGQLTNFALRRRVPTQDTPSYATLIADSSTMIVPRYTTAHAGSLVRQQLPGLTFATNVPWIHSTLRFLGGKASLSQSPRSEQGRSDPSGISNDTLLVWSPYSFTEPSVVFDDISTPTEARSAELRTYFLTNLRTLFGVDVTMTEVSGYLDAMPII
jgi:hypothetical protein